MPMDDEIFERDYTEYLEQENADDKPLNRFIFATLILQTLDLMPDSNPRVHAKTVLHVCGLAQDALHELTEEITKVVEKYV